jgi:hypothetical protein
LCRKEWGGKVTQKKPMQVTEKLTTFSEFSRQDEHLLSLRFSSATRSVEERGWDG